MPTLPRPVLGLHHVSDQGDIACFQPRLPVNPDAGVHRPVVWAVSQPRLADGAARTG